MFELIIAHKAEILGILFLISEIMGSNPKIKANSLYQFAKELIKKAAGK